VAMDDALAMGVVERLGGLADDAQHLAQARALAGLQAGAEVRAVDEFEGEVEEPLRFAGVEQGDDVGMQQPAGGAGLAQQALLALVDLLGPAGETHGLDRQLAVDLRIEGEVDLAHGAGSQEPLDAIAADAAAAVQRVHGSPWLSPSSARGSPAMAPSSPVATSSRWLSRALASS